MISLGNTQKVENILKECDIRYSIYSEISGEPTDLMVNKGVDLYRKENCDFLIALGGGSVIDTMKAIASLAKEEKNISDYMGKVIDVETPNMVAVPTTAGTGSEATKFTIITDTEKDVKMLLKGDSLMPDLSIIDPQFTLTAPKKVTAFTGLDALCHAVEAFTSKKSQPLSDSFALSAVERIFKYLPIAYKDGKNKEARNEMALAALEGGIAFNNSSVTLIHGMSRPIGAIFHIPHGLSNAMLLKVCLTYALPGTYERFAELGRRIGLATNDEEDKKAAESFLQAVINLTEELEIPTLEEYGVDKDKFFSSIDKMTDDALESGSPQNTIRDISRVEIVDLYKELWN